MNPEPVNSKLRPRLTLLLIATAFFSPFLIAAALFFGGFRPEAKRNYGELLQPPQALPAAGLVRADGSRYEWQPERNTWRFLVAPAPGCVEACTRTLDALHRIWFGQGRKADRIEVLWLGELPPGPRFRALVPMRPDAAVAAALPEAAQADALPVYLVDPKGNLALHYHPGFDPSGVRKDLGKLVK